MIINFYINYILLPLGISFIVCMFLNNFLIFYLNKYKVYQNKRLYGPENQKYKKKIPTMGGGLILLFFIFFLIYYIINEVINIYILNLIIFVILNCLLGLLDDYIKCYVNNSNGLSILNKFLIQFILSIIFVYFLYRNYYNYLININLYNLNFNILYIILWFFLLLGLPNSVNITDGLDGLVTFPLILNYLFLLTVSIYNLDNSSDNNLNFIKYLIFIINIIIGYLLSFLYYNFYPAKFFLGDTGSLSLGFLLCILYIYLKKELFILLNGLVFIIEILSVILQIIYFKLFGKKIFLMSPIHHHYELMNYKEINIVFFFWIISFVSFLISLLFFLKYYVCL